MVEMRGLEPITFIMARTISSSYKDVGCSSLYSGSLCTFLISKARLSIAILYFYNLGFTEFFQFIHYLLLSKSTFDRTPVLHSYTTTSTCLGFFSI